MTADLYTLENKKAGTIELPQGAFGAKWNPSLVHQVVVSQLANQRKPIAHTKTRGEVRGGGKKPWAQKHTGRARHSSIRSPLWAGGGITFGPRNERSFKKKVNQKMKVGALLSVLSRKFSDGEIRIVDTFSIESKKTKHFKTIVGRFFKNTKENAVIVAPSENKNIFSAGRNLQNILVISPEVLNSYHCLTHMYIFFDKATIPYFGEKSAKLRHKK